MKELFYLRNTLNNLSGWFDGFICCLLDFDNSDMPLTYHQMVILYEKMISEIIDHSKNLVKDIEEGECIET